MLAKGSFTKCGLLPKRGGASSAKDLLAHVFLSSGVNGFDRVRAEVIASNSRAFKLYRHDGFTESMDEVRHSKSCVMLSKKVT
ncbi:MAG: ribosomal protein S18 acetylase RimI-like enzyme [Akkermansiaceae bacterium]|jgi:ribosomal protein S18 acetylase RimI-like enzyme